MNKKPLIEVGWREEVLIPELTKHKIKAKVDTGARTSALHVTNLELIPRGTKTYAHFKIHPMQDSSTPAIKCVAKVLEQRKIRSSTGHASIRPVISLELKVGSETFETEVTLVNRDLMGFRMLLGRKALKGRFTVNVAKSFRTSKKLKKK